MIGPTDPVSANTNANATGTMRSMVAWPATASSPKRAMKWVVKAPPTGGREVGRDRRQRHAEHRPRIGQQRTPHRPAQNPVPLHREQAEQGRGATRQHGADRGSLEAEMQHEDQQRIQAGQQTRRPQGDGHRAARIADRAQQRRASHVERDQRQERRDDRDVDRGRPQHRAARPETVQDRVQQQHGAEADQQHDRTHDHQRRRGDATCLFAAPGADPARHHGAEADRHADRDRHLHVGHGAGERDRGGQRAIAQQRDVEQVEEVDREHREQPERAGAGHHHGMAQDRAGAEACDPGRHRDGIGVSHPRLRCSHALQPHASRAARICVGGGAMASTGGVRGRWIERASRCRRWLDARAGA